jgi:hypothetical protein
MLAIRSVRPAAAILLTSLLLSACSSGSVSAPPRSTGPTVGGVSVATPVRRPAPPGSLPQARIQSLPGAEGVIGATTAELARLFGAPRLDVWEGDARKLQFTGNPCVLDVYLYPMAPGREPQATYVDARRPSDGRDVDRVSCINGLRRR